MSDLFDAYPLETDSVFPPAEPTILPKNTASKGAGTLSHPKIIGFTLLLSAAACGLLIAFVLRARTA